MSRRPPRPIPIDRARELLRYDPLTGLLHWRVRRSFTALPDTVAGHVRKRGRYRGVTVYIDNVGYKAHRVIWAMETGEQPPEQIDHEDTDEANNRWINLRPATATQQMGNRKINKNSSSGIKGVRWCGASRKWVASIGENGTRRTLGRFSTKEAAAAAYAEAAQRIWGKFARP